MTPPAPRRLSLARRLAFAGIALLLLVPALEVGLRIAAAVVGPQQHVEAPADVPAANPDAIRVVAVGDSWVYGAEAEPDEAFIEVFRRRVEAATSTPVQVYNLGVSASNSAQALVRLHEVIEVAQPQYVVALTGNNNLLHDTAVLDAARLMGQDARMVPGLTWLSRFRVVKLARLLFINFTTPPVTAAEAPRSEAPPLLTVSGGTDPTSSTGLPDPPAIDPIPLFDGMPWWSAFVRRQWEIGLAQVQGATPPDDSPEQRGLLAAWEALFLAHLDRFDEAEARAADALRLGGDRVVAHEARAVAAERDNRPLVALQHRIRAADAVGQGHPWVSARARALALMELEMWEAALAWLLPVLDAVPGNLEALTALARLPGAARTPAVEAHLSEGPRNSGIRQAEYFEWHRISSGMVDRMRASLGTPDPGEVEPFDLRLARARLLEQTDRAEEAAALFGALVDAAPLRRDRARAWAGLVRTSGAVPPGERPALDAEVAAALVEHHRTAGDCDEALRIGQAGLAAGLDAMGFELAAGDCLSREVGWSLTEQALGRGPILDRVALVLGVPAGAVRGPVPPPRVPWWPAFRERRFDEILADPALTPGWRALVLAHLERPADALRVAAEATSADPAAVALAKAMAADQRGDFRTALIERVRAAEAEGGDVWLRYLARGTAQAGARRWKAAQRDLLGVLRAAPGYLEALEVLAEVPEQVRFDATQTVLRWTPSGHVPRHRWSRWYASQGRDAEVAMALRWPPESVPRAPLEAAEVTFAEARLAFDDGDLGRGRALLESAGSAFVALERPDRACAVRTFELDLRPDDVTDAELDALATDCAAHPAAMEVAGRLAVRKGNCATANVWVRTALEVGADPAELLDWIDPCTPTETFESWVRGTMTRPGVPSRAADWMRARMRPQEEVDPAPAGRSYAADLLLSHLDAMARLSRAQGAEFLALTYPFPGAHHERLRDALVAGAASRGVPVLDLYGHFQSTYSAAQWNAMRTPQDHIDAGGYREMGEVLFRAWFAAP